MIWAVGLALAATLTLLALGLSAGEWRAAGPEGKLRLEGIFAMNLTVEFDG